MFKSLFDLYLNYEQHGFSCTLYDQVINKDKIKTIGVFNSIQISQMHGLKRDTTNSS